MASKRERERAAKRSSSSETTGTTETTGEQPVTADAAARTAALSVDKDDDKGPTTAREYFARCGRPETASAMIGDVISILEHFELTPRPETHAR